MKHVLSMRRNLITISLSSFLILLLTHTAFSDVTINGTIQIFNGVNGNTEPLRRARVRVILWEYVDYDTFDVETTTDNNGNYSITKGDPWFRADGYSAKVVVLTQDNSRLTVFAPLTNPGDAYQAYSSIVTAPPDATTTIDLTIGGTNENVATFLAGGNISIADVGIPQNATIARQAFSIYHEMSDHVQRLINMAGPITGDFHHKSVVFPAAEVEPGSTAYYFPVLDTIRISSASLTSPQRLSELARHEFSHGVMADLYPFNWPGISHFAHGHFPFAVHSLSTEWDHHAFALSEAWAEFLAEVTFQDKYGSSSLASFDYEVNDSGWVPTGNGIDHALVEGQIASALWDIHDPTGWERRFDQVGLAGAFEQKVTVWELTKLAKLPQTLAISAKSRLLACSEKSSGLGEKRRFCGAKTVAKNKVSKRSLRLSFCTGKGFRPISGTVPLAETVTFCRDAPADPSSNGTKSRVKQKVVFLK